MGDEFFIRTTGTCVYSAQENSSICIFMRCALLWMTVTLQFFKTCNEKHFFQYWGLNSGPQIS
jgi:hypothetical protein